MSIDPARAAFVQQEYRYAVQEDSSVKADFPTAREIVIETNLSEADAGALAVALFNTEKTHQLIFEIGLDKEFYLEDFAEYLPRFQASLPDYPLDDRILTSCIFRTDYMTGRTTVVVRG